LKPLRTFSCEDLKLQIPPLLFWILAFGDIADTPTILENAAFGGVPTF
jgi:hypothetical protein